ncbi:MAG TPA: hypothetical protein VFT43_13395 [Candidatus Polarisedimenticolia bacterium]|nr:hypothetical protein [Candidatus Polarisedimenticolia bacterium]
MAAKNVAALAQMLNLSITSKGGPLGPAGAAGSIEGYPVAVAWGARQKQSSLVVLVRFRKESLKAAPGDLAETVATSPEILAATGRRKISGAERQALAVGPDALVYYWDYSLRAPKPEAAAALVRALLALVKGMAAPVGSDCEICGGARTAELFSVNGALIGVCSGCRQRMGEEDRRAAEEYAGRPSNPLLGTAAGVAAAMVMALLWGGVAYSINRIFLWGGILIGVAIAWSINKGMGKVNLYGRGLTVLLTIASVLLGDFFFLWLSAAQELQEPVSLDLAGRLAPHFLTLEFSESSGYLSVLFGLVGAIYILFANRPPAMTRVFAPVGRSASA